MSATVYLNRFKGVNFRNWISNNTMKQLFTAILLIHVVFASAQTAPDFTITDIDGNSHNLYNTLDEGKVVVLKFFTNWCGICNNTADNVQALFDSYQSNNNPVEFWALDRDANETNVHATTYRDNNNLTFPVIGEANWVANLYGVQYQPEYKIICTDRSFEEEVSYTAVDQHVQACLAQITDIQKNEKDETIRFEHQSGNLWATWQSAATGSGNLTLVDVLGRPIANQTINRGETVVFSGLQSGVYISVLEHNGRVAKGKVAVAK